MSKEVFETYLEDVSRVQEFYDTFSFSLEKVPSDGGSVSYTHLTLPTIYSV